MSHRWALVLAAVTAGVACVVTAVLYLDAFASLGADGPNATGFGYLLVANRAVVVDGVVLSSIGVLVAAAGRARFVVGGLLVAAAVTFTAGAGAEMIGRALVAIDPTSQSIELNSLLLAMQGSGADVLPASIVFTGAALVVLVRRARRLPVQTGRAARA